VVEVDEGEAFISDRDIEDLEVDVDLFPGYVTLRVPTLENTIELIHRWRAGLEVSNKTCDVYRQYWTRGKAGRSPLRLLFIAFVIVNTFRLP